MSNELGWSDLPSTAHKLIADAIASEHRVSWRGHVGKGRAYLTVTIATTDHDGAEETFSGHWRCINGQWRFWYGDMSGERLTLTGLRSFVVDDQILAEIASR